MANMQTDEPVTRAGLDELLRVHLDEPMRAISRRWLRRCLCAQASIGAAVIAAIRL